MNFRDPGLDAPLLTQLANHSVILPKDWEAFEKPTEGNLTDAIAMNAIRINPQAWVYWLVKRHGFHRLPNPEHDVDLLSALRWGPDVEHATEFFGTYPFLRRGRTGYFVSLRPDVKSVLPALREWLFVDRVLLFALTPAELTTWRRFTSVFH